MITFIANDFGPATALRKVSEECLQRGMATACWFRSDLHPETSLEEHTRVLVSGMAFKPEAAEHETRLIKEAAERGIPVVLYADTWGCAARPWFTDIRHSVNTVWVVDLDDVGRTKSLYPQASILPMGNPLWVDAAFHPRGNPELKARLGLDPKAKVTLLVLRKEPEINHPLIEVCGEALSKLEYPTSSLARIASVHPSAPDPAQYERALEASGFVQTGEKSLDLLSIADVVVNAGSGTGIEAIYMRRPVLEYSAEVVLDEVERLHYTRVWKPVGSGAALPFVTAGELAVALVTVLTQESVMRRRLNNAMDIAFPISGKKESTVQMMCDTLAQFCT